MKTLILFGSPHTDGDTAALTNALTAKLSGEHKLINCYTANIAPCADCRCCRERLFCPIDDEMQEVYEYLAECDNVIIASPVHYAEFSAMLLKVVSRLQMYSSALIFRHETLPVKAKRGAVLLTQGGSGGAERAFETAKIIFRSIGIKEVLPLVCSQNTDKLPAVRDEKALAEAGRVAGWLNACEENREPVGDQ